MYVGRESDNEQKLHRNTPPADDNRTAVRVPPAAVSMYTEAFNTATAVAATNVVKDEASQHKNGNTDTGNERADLGDKRVDIGTLYIAPKRKGKKEEAYEASASASASVGAPAITGKQ